MGLEWADRRLGVCDCDLRRKPVRGNHDADHHVGQDSLNGTMVGRSPAVMIEQPLEFDHLHLKIAIETIEVCGAKLAAMSIRVHDFPIGLLSLPKTSSGLEILEVREIISHSARSSGSSFFRWFASHLWSSSQLSFCSSGA